MLFSERKSYTEINVGGDRGDRLSKTLENYAVERTGKTDTVAGYSCEVWRIKEKDARRVKSDICVAKGFGKTASFWVEPNKAQSRWVSQLVEDGGFGIRNISYDETGNETSRMEVTAIEKKSLDGSFFAVPADYSKIEMGAMGGGSGGDVLRRKMEERKQRRMEQGGAVSGGQKPDASEMMKQFEEMMKRKQPGGQ